MRSCLGTILLIILVAMIVITAFYHWDTNARIEFSSREEGEPPLTEKKEKFEDMVAPRKEDNPLIGKDVMKMEVPAPSANTREEPPAEQTTHPSTAIGHE